MNVGALYERYHDSLVRYLARYSGDLDLAEDAAHEAFLRLAERPPADSQGVRAWLFTVGTNLVRDAWRSGRRRSTLLQASQARPGIGTPTVGPEATLEQSETRRLVRTALDALSDRDRRVLLMREEGFKHREIGDALGIPTKSVGTVIARALKKLADHLPTDMEDRA